MFTPAEMGLDLYVLLEVVTADKNHDASCPMMMLWLKLVVMYTINSNSLKTVNSMVRKSMTFDVMLIDMVLQTCIGHFMIRAKPWQEKTSMVE